MKKFILIIFIIILFTGCRNTDSILFKEEYERLNSNSTYTKVNIPSDNSFVYIKDIDLANLIDKKEDLIVLFGYNKSNETRDIIDDLLSLSQELNIEKFLYLDIFDIRDEKNIENGEVVITEEASEGYNKIIELLNDSLDDYIINDKTVGKRIYAPTILIIKNQNIEVLKNVNNIESNELKSLIERNLVNNNTCSVNESC